MKQTPFTKFHIELGARMVPFAGYNMPIEYTGINDEHINVREKLGVFDEIGRASCRERLSVCV